MLSGRAAYCAKPSTISNTPESSAGPSFESLLDNTISKQPKSAGTALTAERGQVAQQQQ